MANLESKYENKVERKSITNKKELKKKVRVTETYNESNF